MPYFCHACGNEQIFEVKVGVKVGRRDECPHCGVDLHCCKNCTQFDASLHNQCREPEATFIRDREVGNFCHHFSFKEADAWKQDRSVDEAKKKLAALFKNLK